MVRTEGFEKLIMTRKSNYKTSCTPRTSTHRGTGTASRKKERRSLRTERRSSAAASARNRAGSVTFPTRAESPRERQLARARAVTHLSAAGRRGGGTRAGAHARPRPPHTGARGGDAGGSGTTRVARALSLLRRGLRLLRLGRLRRGLLLRHCAEGGGAAVPTAEESALTQRSHRGRDKIKNTKP